MKPSKLTLTTRCDHLKGNWFVWYCQAEMPDGSVIDGTVQADGCGEGVAVETFERSE